MTEENNQEVKINEVKQDPGFKALKKVDKPRKGGKDKKLIESRDSLKALRKYTREKNIDNTILTRKIEAAWLFVKESFAKIASQRRNHKYLLLIYQKGSIEIKREFFNATMENIVLVSYNEHGKGLVLHLYQANESNKSRILETIKNNIKPLVTNTVAITLLDQLYNLNRTEKRSGFSSIATQYASLCEDPNSKEEISIDTTKDSIQIYKQAFPKSIFKLFDKRLLSFELVHDILFHYFNAHPEKYSYLYGLLIRNKQFKYLLLTHKGLEVCLGLIKHNDEDVMKYLELLDNDFVTTVNNKYGVVWILKIMEINKVEYNKAIVEQYIKNYKTIFTNDESLQPLIYLFNQEKKLYSTLFNHCRSKVMVEIDRSSYIDDLRKMVVDNLDVFASSFCYPLVFWMAKKDPETNKIVKKFFKGIEVNNAFTEKLEKKLLKYKIIKNKTSKK